MSVYLFPLLASTVGQKCANYKECLFGASGRAVKAVGSRPGQGIVQIVGHVAWASIIIVLS